MSQNFDEVTAGSPVAQFYENRVILITGSTGFMGKVRKIGYFTGFTGLWVIRLVIHIILVLWKKVSFAIP